MAVSKGLPNGGSKSKSGTATPAVATEQQAQSTLPPVVGINFGNSYASIAVFTKEGVAESIANEDGERQIACAISFHGEELYIGNQAKHQLVKNAKNTIVGFRNLLGKKFSEIQPTANPTSSPVIQHPTEPDEPAYRVTVLQPSPAPLPASTPASHLATPLGSVAPTPRSEPISVERTLTPQEVTSIFLRSLIQSAEDFLGKKIEGAVLTVPESFTPKQHDALLKAAADAGLNVLQLLDDAVVDAGASSLSLTLLSIRHGLAYVLASSHSEKIQPGNQIDNALLKHFATEFTKKTKVPSAPSPSLLPHKMHPSSTPSALSLLPLEVQHAASNRSKKEWTSTPRLIGSDSICSLDQLHSHLKRHRALLEQAQLDAHDIDELSRLREDVESPFARGTVIGGGVGELKNAFTRETKANEVKATSKTLGLLFPSSDPTAGDGLGGLFIPAVAKETLSPHAASSPRRSDRRNRVEKVKPPPFPAGRRRRRREEEELEIKHRTLTKSSVLGSLVVDANLGIKATGKLANEELRGTWSTRVQATVVVGIDGDVEVSIVEGVVRARKLL
ncbi:hypothetical protein BDQ17DRAFT_1544996 [Cyathus striatus]|nr:hypothetical protein BDQ17DRAFT_1544996 [Cyathus striatus]